MNHHATVKVKQERIVIKELALITIEMTFEQDEAHKVTREDVEIATLDVMEFAEAVWLGHH